MNEVPSEREFGNGVITSGTWPNQGVRVQTGGQLIHVSTAFGDDKPFSIGINLSREETRELIELLSEAVSV
jgi:hypothetical protein